MTPPRRLLVAALAIVAAAVAVCGASPGVAATTPGTFGPVKSYLVRHTALLQDFTGDFQMVANRYYAAAKRSGFDYATLARDPAVRRDLTGAKALWVRGNPYYERVEGIVAGTPSLAVYDVILDAGSSFALDPASRFTS